MEVISFMRDENWIIETNRQIAADIYEMKLTGGTRGITAPGQFINILLENKFLRRPLSIADCSREGITLVYRVVGEGTEILKEMKPGGGLKAMCPLGNGYNLEKIPSDAVLAGGGMGAAPIYFLAKKLALEGKAPKVILGFKNEEEIFFREEFEKLGLDLKIKTGGILTDCIETGSYVCACGPLPMMKAAFNKAADGQFGFEERMGCGFGSCMGCVCKSITGEKRICKDGPVFCKEEILWQIQE